MAEDDFNEKDVINRLLWCGRHCCLCGKPCGPHIQMAHLVKRGKPGSGDIDNGSPLCLECHAIIGAYDPDHGMGKKFNIEELKKRREQVYDEHTRHLVPPIDFKMSQVLDPPDRELFIHTLPQIGFYIMHIGDSLPVRVLVKLELSLGKKQLKVVKGSYTGDNLWHMNPHRAYWGHYKIREAEELAESKEKLKAIVSIKIIDTYERHHELLPISWNYKEKQHKFKGKEYGDWVPRAGS